MLPNRDSLEGTNQEANSSYNQINALMLRESNQQQDDLFLRSLKAIGLMPAGARWSTDSEETRTDQQLAYRENVHRIPEGQDGLITTFLKQRGSLDWRAKYQGWGTWSHHEISMFSAFQKTEDNGRTVTTFLASDNKHGEMEVRQGLQIIDEAVVKQPENSDSSIEILDDNSLSPSL
ncbi:MAG: hypothetical protein Q8R83_06630 [Legionellaceae bacterium]|nr:hypothetical protein [Legionellaceae bacterium]